VKEHQAVCAIRCQGLDINHPGGKRSKKEYEIIHFLSALLSMKWELFSGECIQT